MDKTIGFFGGTFDPIHFGHLNLAIQLLERYHLDEILFCPTSISPLKRDLLPVASVKDRLAMLNLSISPVAEFTLLATEAALDGPAYTIDTMRELVKEAKKRQDRIHYHLLLGEDAIVHLHQWKEIEDLLILAPPLIGSRSGQIDPSVLGSLSPLVRAAVKKGMAQTALMDISSTLIRKRLSEGLYCGHLVPANVLDYINEHQIY